MPKRGGMCRSRERAFLTLTIGCCALLTALMIVPARSIGQVPRPTHHQGSGYRPAEIAAAKGAPIPDTPDAASDEILVQFKADRSSAAISRIQAAHGIAVRESKRLDRLDWHRLRIAPGHGLKSVVEAYRRDPDVLYAEPNYRLYAHQRVVPNDTRFKELYGLDNTGQTRGAIDADIDAPEAWASATNSSVVVAVVDTGVDHSHPDLAANIWSNADEIAGNGVDDDGNGYIDDARGWDFVNHDNDPMDDHGHGTHCAGTIGAIGNNNVGVAGVCWRVKIMPLKFLSASGTGTTADAIEAVAYAANNGAKVLNNSWGGGSYSVSLESAIALCESRGAIFVAAAGNSATNNDASPHYPSSYANPNIIAVAATTYTDELASFSCYGATSVDLGAPGSGILSTLPGAAYGLKSGTSMATPHVAGACALIWSLSGGTAPWADIRSAIVSSVDPIPNLAGKCASGGRLNVHAALQAVNNGRRLTLASPRGGAFETGSMIPINWRAEGGGWQTGDEVAIHYSTDSGTNWTGVAGGEHLDHAAASFSWDSSTLSIGTNYLVRVMALAESNAAAIAEVPFTVTGPFDHFDFSMASPQPCGRPVGGHCMLTAKDGAGRRITTFSSYAATGRFPISITAPGVTIANLGGAGHQLETNHFSSGNVNLARLNMTLTASPLPHVGPLTATSADGKIGVSGPVAIRTTPDYFTEYFEAESCDITNRTVVFTPDGSADFYSARQYPITQLPTDPVGGTVLAIGDDAYQFVTLSGGATVSFYGNTNQSLAVGSNGYITFKYGDTTNAGTSAAHFSLPRVAAWFDDLYATNGQITWKQLADRMAVTWQEVHEYGTEATCTFQIEMFFDGRIALSYLNIGAIGGLAGLSRGGGEPGDFRESDLSAFPGPAARTLRLVAPNGGEINPRDQSVPLRWSATGTDWSAGDTVSLQYSTDGGTSWTPITDAASLPYDQGAFAWSTADLPPGDRYLVRAAFTGDTGIRDDSDQWFTLLATDRQINLVTPAGGDFIDIGQTIPIAWATTGGDWQPGDSVRLEYSRDGGASWSTIVGADTLPYNQGAFSWDTAGLARGTTYRLRVVWATDPAVGDATGPNLILRRAYYVNDQSRDHDVWCTMWGYDGFTGTTPGDPKATLQSLLAYQNLEPGDVVRIDTGTYTITTNITVTAFDEGTEQAPVTFEASPYGVTITRDVTPLDTYAWNISGDHIVLRTAASNKYPTLAQRWLLIKGMQYGIYLNGALGVRLERIHIAAMMWGINAYQSHDAVFNNIISQRQYYGIRIISSDGCSIEHATILKNSMYGVYASDSRALSLHNSLIWVSGSGDACVYMPSGSLISDYNDFYATSLANVGYYQGTRTGLKSWQSATGQDAHSIFADPLFVDADGADNISGNADDDLHLQSTSGSYHNGGWTADATTSPLIDMGIGDAGAEPEPNSSAFASEVQGRRNLGAYGGTGQASKTPAARLLTLAGPSGRESFANQADPISVTWRLSGSGWTTEDTVQILYSSDNGVSYHPIGGAEAVPAQAGTFSWDVSGLPASAQYRLRIVSNADGAPLAETLSAFRVGADIVFYVNDGSVVNDAWCTAPGNDANTGASPDAPKATVRALIGTYDLEPGDIVRIDTGNYTTDTEIAVDIDDSGGPSLPVIVEGSPYGTLLSRSGSTAGTVAWRISATNVTIRTAEPGSPTTLPLAWMALGGGSNTISLMSAHGFVMERVHVQNNNSSGIGATNSSGVVLRNCILRAGARPHSFVASDNCVLEQSTVDGRGMIFVNCSNTVMRNSIIWARNSGQFAIEQTASTLLSDYNDLFASDGANLALIDGLPLFTVPELRSATSNEFHSISADPLFADDFHVRSSEGRYRAGAWTNDATDSPTIDMGVGDGALEPQPNASSFATEDEGRRNLGAYGGTSIASKTPSTRGFNVITPIGGDKISDLMDVRWRACGLGWQAGDTIQIFASSNGGVSFGAIPGAEALAIADGSFLWSLTNTPPSPAYRLRFVSNLDSNRLAETAVNIRLGPGPFTFYVNDAASGTDAWCAAIGADSNTGITPDSPRASIQSILADYDLDPGDTVCIDTGTYYLTNSIVVRLEHRGTNGAPVTFAASPYGVVIDRVTSNSGSMAWQILSKYVVLSTSSNAPALSAPQSWAIIKGGYDAISLQNAGWLTLSGLRIMGAGRSGIYASDAGLTAVQNCLIEGNGGSGVELVSSDSCRLEQNTIVANGKHAISINGAMNPSIINNVLIASGTGNSVIYTPYVAAISDYNILFATNGANIGQWNGSARPTMPEWRAASGQDINSLNFDPSFVDADGPDNVAGNADDDLHLQSTAGSYHGGAWTADALNSPGIDAGIGDAAQEPEPNRASISSPELGQRNLGAYGGTPQASKTPWEAIFRMVSPLGGERLLDPGTTLPISWHWSGRDWAAGETISILVSSDGGATFNAIPGAEDLAVTAGAYETDMTAWPPSAAYRIRVTRNSDGTILDETTSNFRFGLGAFFYVNDGTTNLDLWCSTMGDDANDGATPATPKASLQDLLADHKLEPGDVVRLDSGLYSLQSEVCVGREDGGVPGRQVTFEASPLGVCFDRGTNAGNCWKIDADYVTVRTGVPQSTNTPAAWMRLSGGDIAMQLFRSVGFQIERLTLTRARLYGLNPYYSYDGAIENCLSYSNRVGFYLDGTWRCRLENDTASHNSDSAIKYAYSGELIVRNNIFGNSNGTWVAADVVTSSSGTTLSDFNFLCKGQATLGQEAHSAALDPMFVDPDGPDNMLGTADDDFHLQSTAGSYHGGQWTSDAADSPAIDFGWGDPGPEPEPNSSAFATDDLGRRNLGAYGHTEQASKTPAAPHIFLASPIGGEKFMDRSNAVQIVWRATGTGWNADDTLTLMVSSDGGREFYALAGAEALSPTNIQFSWDITGAIASRAYVLRVIRAGEGVPFAQSGSPIRIGIGAPLYVNDGQTNFDEWCIAPGDDANDGFTAASPKATLASVLSAYLLEPGDVVHIDTGTYAIDAGVVIPASPDGTAALPIVVEGSPYGVRMMRAGAAAGSRAFSIAAEYVTLRTASGTRHPNAPCTMMTIGGGETALYSQYAHGLRLEALRITSGKYGLHNSGSDNGVMWHCLVDHTSVAGLYSIGSEGWTIEGNTVAPEHGDGMFFDTGATNRIAVVRNSIISGAGPTSACLRVVRGWIESDFNDLAPTDGAAIGDWRGRHMTLVAWCATNGQDANSVSADPLFVDTDGPDNIAGTVDDDFHLQSTAGSYHADAWLADGANSIGIDTGSGDAGLEPEPNRSPLHPSGFGERNLGAYGGTAQASKTPPARMFWCFYMPRGGEKYFDQAQPVPLRWTWIGTGWASGEPLSLTVSPDAGSNFTAVTGGDAIPVQSGGFAWDIASYPPGLRYRLRITDTHGGTILDQSTADFRIGRGAVFYVNDSNINADEWCTAPGNDGNTGETPSFPKATVQSVLASYDLEGGDEVRIDTGTYSLTNDITVAESDGGSASSPVRFVASPYGVTMDRGDLAAGYAWNIMAPCISIFTTNGTRHPALPERWIRVSGAQNGFRLMADSGTLERCVADANYIGVYLGGNANPLVVRNCLSINNELAGIYNHLSNGTHVDNCTLAHNGNYGFYGAYSFCWLTNSIIVADAPGSYGIYPAQIYLLSSDYNLIFTTNGGFVGRLDSNFATLAEWQSVMGIDTNSIEADPLFVNEAAGDYHLQSTAGSYHGGAWLADGADSPAIDMGDPALPVGAETAPSGLIRNLGAYGGTEQASRSSDADGDQLSENFEMVRLGTDPARFDTDGDGRGDGAEIIATTDPLDRGSYFCLSSFAIQGGDAIVRFLSAANRDYLVEFSTDLRDWTPLPNGIAEGTGGIVEIVDPGASSSPCRFYRARVIW